MQVLLSIRPKYSKRIFSGEKKYEFRKTIFSKKNIERVYIYSTAPVKKVVGFFTIGEVIVDHPQRLWSRLKKYSGLSQIEFFRYFRGNEKGFAIEIENVEVFINPINPKDLRTSFIPPQSFYYVDPHTFLPFLYDSSNVNQRKNYTSLTI